MAQNVNYRFRYVFRIKPDEKYYKFSGAKYEEGTSWSSPYFWCIDPVNWLVTAMSPIWATNDREYKNRIFATDAPLRLFNFFKNLFFIKKNKQISYLL